MNNADRTADAASASSGQDEDDITVSGALLDGYFNVSEAKLQLVTGLGETSDERTVLVPYVDVELACERGSDEVEGRLKGLLAFDNAAFIVDEFAEAFARIAQQLEELSRGGLAPHAPGVTYALGRIRHARLALDEAASSLVRLSETRDEDAG